MIPETLDPVEILNKLNALGIKDAKIGIHAGLPVSYIESLRYRRIRKLTYERAAKLLNLVELVELRKLAG